MEAYYLREQQAAISGTETILVVDDEEVVRLVLRTILAYRGYQIVDVSSGEEAIAKIHSTPLFYDLVLLDINMPGLNGWETLERLRAERADIPTILLSGGPAEGAGEKALEAGAAALLLKPFQNSDLLRLVRKTLDAAKIERN